MQLIDARVSECVLVTGTVIHAGRAGAAKMRFRWCHERRWNWKSSRNTKTSAASMRAK